MVATFLLEILLAMHNRINANPASGLGGPMYKAAIKDLYLVQNSGLWGHMGTIKHTLLFQLQRCSLLESLLQN
jgi:hypothetical protein